MVELEALREFTLADLFEQFPDTIPVFLRNGMACVGCDVNGLETVAEAIALYNLAEERFLKELAAVLGTAHPSLQQPDTLREDKQ
jgi:hybrid cluster-associated redox disulfide protein